jgi:intermediate cleaving peptidase 55
MLIQKQELGGYISDITRTWPVNGKFSDPQRDLYNAVLNVHRTCLALCREDANLSLDKLHSIAENGLKDQLKQLGFDLSGSVCAEDPVSIADVLLTLTRQ